MSRNAESSRIAEIYSKRDSESAEAYTWLARDIHSTIFSVDYAMAETLKRHQIRDLRDKQILDVGCGRGRWLRVLHEWGAAQENLYGIEINPRRIEYAQSMSPGFEFGLVTEGGFPFSDLKFDVVTLKTVFSSILDPELRKKLASDVSGVVAKNGLVIVFDFRVASPRNENTIGISLKEIERLFPGCKVSSKTVVLAPPLMRMLCRLSPHIAIFVEWLCPFLRTHRIYTIRA
jgi:SAM-dependent methyltransferase